MLLDIGSDGRVQVWAACKQPLGAHHARPGRGLRDAGPDQLGLRQRGLWRQRQAVPGCADPGEVRRAEAWTTSACSSCARLRACRHRVPGRDERPCRAQLAGPPAIGHRGAAHTLARAAGEGREARDVRADRAGRRYRRGQPRDHRPAATATLPAQRPKIWISLADIADHFLVFATVDRTKGLRGSPRSSSSAAWPASPPARSTESSASGRQHRADLPRRRAASPSRTGSARKARASSSPWARSTRAVHVAAGAVGLAQACLDASSAPMSARRSGRRSAAPAGQADDREDGRRHRGGRLLVPRAGWLKNRGLRNTRETSLAKWYCTDQPSRARWTRSRSHGAYGYSSEFPSSATCATRRLRSSTRARASCTR